VTVDLRQFRYFIAVAEERHFGRAAAQLHIAQSGLSQQILKLERAVGVQLLIRDRRGVEVTDAGRVFLDHARRTVELADRAVASAVLAARGKDGLLRVGQPILGIPPVAGQAVEAFRDRYPDVELEFNPRLHSELIDGITNHTLDVAIVFFPFKSVEPKARYQQLGTFELVVILPEGHRLAELERIPRSELLEESFVDWPRNANPEMTEHIHRIMFGTPEHPRTLQVPDLDDAHRLEHVANGEGFGISGLPSGPDLPVPGVVFRRLDPPTPLIGYGVAWVDGHPSAVDPFLEVAREFADPTPLPIPA
jgi:DNA-binding transcriptional LysR family regulator